MQGAGLCRRAAVHRSAGFQPALLPGPQKRAGRDAGATKNAAVKITAGKTENGPS